MGELDSTSICTHLSHFLASESNKTALFEKYKTSATWSFRRSQNAIHPNKRRKLSSPSCGSCGLTLARPFVCLHCSFSGCWKDDHIVDHLRDNDHSFCSDVKTGRVYCSHCEDFILDSAMEEVFSSSTLKAEEKGSKFQVTKKGRDSYEPWTPNEQEISALEDSIPIPCQGRRGLLNLGQTCFLNVILQSFIHNPLLRNFFLSEKHNHRTCKMKDCTCCEMDNLFSEIYSGETVPYGPISFLATTWRASSELSGYAQQDAHEFFITALNQVHATCRGSTNVSCNCIIHNTFSGQLQSEVKCERCGNVTTTVDPMLDISLELEGDDGEAGIRNTLGSCLRRFTQPETLGSKEYSCSKCKQTPPEVTKRLSIRTLPPVLSIQFKRFEHRSSDKTTAKKIEARVRFPATINMAPYTTFVVGTKAVAKGKPAKSGTTNGVVDPRFAYPGPDTLYDYDLFAVICHEGQIDNGHYTNFARFQDEWYRFDDDKVTPSTLGQCLRSSAYMCFYVKRHLDYKAYVKPSYVLTRESELVKERQRELERMKEKELERMKEVEDALLATVTS